MKEYIFYALAGAFFWGLADIVTKKLLSLGVSSSSLVFFNSLIALVVALPLFLREFSSEQVRMLPLLLLPR